jgi:hypothetical protein
MKVGTTGNHFDGRMTSHGIRWIAVSILAATLLAGCRTGGLGQQIVAAGPTPTPVSSVRRLIGENIYVEAGGCRSVGRTVNLNFPGRLDASKSGKGANLAGVEFEITTRNGNANFKDVAYLPGASGVSFFIYANGAGTVQGGGSILGVQIPQTCVGAQGASVGINLYAWVFPN